MELDPLLGEKQEDGADKRSYRYGRREADVSLVLVEGLVISGFVNLEYCDLPPQVQAVDKSLSNTKQFVD
jgi:hypothetical protein